MFTSNYCSIKVKTTIPIAKSSPIGDYLLLLIVPLSPPIFQPLSALSLFTIAFTNVTEISSEGKLIRIYNYNEEVKP